MFTLPLGSSQAWPERGPAGYVNTRLIGRYPDPPADTGSLVICDSFLNL
jgi:hypothetical protein